LLLESFLLTGGALGEQRVRDFLQNIFGESTGFTLVGINGHVSADVVEANRKL